MCFMSGQCSFSCHVHTNYTEIGTRFTIYNHKIKKKQREIKSRMTKYNDDKPSIGCCSMVTLYVAQNGVSVSAI